MRVGVGRGGRTFPFKKTRTLKKQIDQDAEGGVAPRNTPVEGPAQSSELRKFQAHPGMPAGGMTKHTMVKDPPPPPFSHHTQPQP
jgi:hypothetical protein